VRLTDLPEASVLALDKAVLPDDRRCSACRVSLNFLY
jgi:hypothetical protein